MALYNHSVSILQHLGFMCRVRVEFHVLSTVRVDIGCEDV